MANKRKAQEAFGGVKGQLSAFAAAKLARQSGPSTPPQSSKGGRVLDANILVAEVATVPYNGHHSGATTPNAELEEVEASITPPSRGTIVQLSSFRPTQDNVIQDGDEVLQISLQHDETVTFIGEYDLTVDSGIVTIYGAVLRPDSGPKRVYASSTAALPQIQARQQNTIIRISSVKSSLRKLEKLSPLFRNIWAPASPGDRSFALLGTNRDDSLQRSLSSLNIDQVMDTVFRTLSAKTATEPRSPPRIIAVGGKSAGKSTFNRILCNHLNSWTTAKKCLYLDLDPGQPEFTPPRQVSLIEVNAPILGHAFTHPASLHSNKYTTIRSHAMAATTAREDLELYKGCTLELIRHADPRYPLIVNSSGWTTGQGATLLAELTSLLGITDIVLLEPLDTSLANTLRIASNGDVVFHSIPRQPPRHALRTAAEHRAMTTMAYFHHRPIGDRAIPRWSGKPINTVRPWVVSYSGPDAGISAVMFYGQHPSPDFLAEVLDGSVVAITVQDEDGNAPSDLKDEDDLANHISTTPEGIPYITPNDHGISRTLDPRNSHCVGLALVRGINTADKELHLVTPLPEQQIAEELIRRRVFLVKGGSESPEWAYLEDLHKHGDAVSFDEKERPWVSKKAMVGIEGAVWRLRHPPMASAVTPMR